MYLYQGIKFFGDFVGSKIHYEAALYIETIFPTYLKVPRSIGIFDLNIFGDLWGGKALSLYWYECRMDILAYIHVRMKGILV